MSLEQQIQQIDKRILMARLIDLPGTIVFGLAIYAKFYSEGGAFFSFMDAPKVVDSMLAVGLALMVWGGYRIFKLKRERARLVKSA